MNMLSERKTIDGGLYYLHYGADNPKAAYIYIHGGGLVEGSAEEAEEIYSRFVDEGIEFYSLSYRLYPNAKFPDFIEDCAKEIKEILKGIPKDRKVFLGGTSAGSYIAMMLCFDAKYGLQCDRIAGYIFDAGQVSTHFRVKEMNPELPPISDAAPRKFISEETVRNKRFLICAAEYDMPGRREENIELNRILKKLGGDSSIVIFDECAHCSYCRSKDYFDEIIGFMKGKRRLSLLCIGNSFTDDPAAYLHDISLGTDTVLQVCVLYIGGCSLERHAHNIKNNANDYEYRVNGKTLKTGVGIEHYLTSRDWDVVTIQQVSVFSGKKESYLPYGLELVKFIKERQPNARIVFQMTWSYASAFTADSFRLYDYDQKKMDEAILGALETVRGEMGIDEVIPTGSSIRNCRKAYGDIFNRDGFHLNEAGRYIAGLTWALYFATSREYEIFVPDYTTYEINGEHDELVSREEIEKYLPIVIKTLQQA